MQKQETSTSFTTSIRSKRMPMTLRNQTKFSLKASEDFGQTIGNGAGNLVDLTSQLASALNDLKMGVFAKVNDLDNKNEVH